MQQQQYLAVPESGSESAALDLSARPPGTRPQERIQLLFFLSRLDLAGTERQAVELASRLDQQRFEISFATFFKAGPLDEQIRRITGKRLQLTLTSLMGPSFPVAVVRLARYLRKNSIQVLHCFDFYTNIVGAFAGRLAGVPLIVTSRRHIANSLSRRQVWLETRAFRASDWVVTNCQAAADVLHASGVPGDRIRIIYNAIDLAAYQVPSVGSGPTVGMLANLRPAKDHSSFLRAAALVVRKHPAVRFALVGARTQSLEVQEFCRALGIADRVALLGEQPPSRIPDILSSFAVSVLSSHGEGLPNAVVESMAAGVPIVATAVGGCCELVEDGVTGFLVPPVDPVQMAERISQLLADPEMAQAMGKAGRFKISRMSEVSKVIQQWTDFYTQELQRKSALAQ